MPFLVRGKARARQNKISPPAPAPHPVSPAITEPEKLVEQTAEEETKVSYQEITYRVPKEERLLDLPLEEEVFEKEEEKEEKPYKPLDSEEHVSIGAVLKKKKKK